MKLVLVRHGQSEWNAKNLFTGWVDVDLTDKGVEEAKSAGKKIKEEGIQFDKAYTSVLKRALKTCFHILDQLDQLYVPVEKSWRLNERHYGGLTGLDKAETAKKYGEEQVHIWRRSYNVSPPEMTDKELKFVSEDPRYKDLISRQIPRTENLEITLERALPYFEENIIPQIRNENNVLIAAHGNSLRAITKYIEEISDEDILKVEIATGVPIIYELDKDLNILSKKVLA